MYIYCVLNSINLVKVTYGLRYSHSKRWIFSTVYNFEKSKVSHKTVKYKEKIHNEMLARPNSNYELFLQKGHQGVHNCANLVMVLNGQLKINTVL